MSDEKSVIHEAIALAPDVELLLTKNEFGFQRVLDDAQTSKTLYVVTWGILNRTDLLDHIRTHRADRTTVIICRIPARRDSYTGWYAEENRQAAKKDIAEHLDRLDPANLPRKTSVYVNHKNHSKIIATENVAYVGSANFTPGSRTNYEAGVLISNPDRIREMLNRYLPKLMSEVDAYQDRAASKLAVEMGALRSDLATVFERVTDGLARGFDHGYRDDWKGLVYDDLQATLSDQDRHAAMMLAEDVEDLVTGWMSQDRYRPTVEKVSLAAAKEVREAGADQTLRNLSQDNETPHEELAEAAEGAAKRFARGLHGLLESLSKAHEAAVAQSDEHGNLDNTRG